MKKKTLLIVLALACALTCALWLCACVDKNPDSTGGNGTQTQAVETITLDKSEITLEINGEATLTAIITPKSVADKPLTWSASPAGIVTVDNGK